MKSEHRHDLQTNDLGKVVDTTVGYMDESGNKLLIGVCVVAIITAGIIYFVRTSRAKTANAWSALAAARNAEEYMDVAERYQGTVPAQWARLQEAESRLASGVQLMFTDREAALIELKGNADRPKALELFQSLTTESGISPEIRERALYGLGETQETISNGSEAAAIDSYEKLLQEFPKSVFEPAAEKRIAALKRGSSQEFYAWFAKQNPKPAPPPKKPADQTTPSDESLDEFLKSPHPTVPTDTSKKPSGPSLGTTAPLKMEAPKADAKPEAKTDQTETKPEASKDESPKAGAPKAEDKPAAKAETKPAEPVVPAKPDAAKPADAKPADAKPADPKSAETPAKKQD